MSGSMPPVVSPAEWQAARDELLVREKADGRRQLVVYHFMFAPGEAPCGGCSSFTDNIGHLAHLQARDTTFALVSPTPYSETEPYKRHTWWRLHDEYPDAPQVNE
jgi:predicted dithiol-disulfide oxidoreductase (DUF899 family)